MTRSRYRRWTPVLTVALLILLVSGCTAKRRYEVVDREIYEPHKIRLRIAVPYGTSSDDVVDILREVVKKYHEYGDWMEIWLWETEITEEMKEGLKKRMRREGEDLGVPVYPDYEPWLYESRSVYRVTWLYPDLWTIEEYSELLDFQENAISRFSESDRMKIYREVLAAEERVTQRAVSMYGRNLSIMLEANGKMEEVNRQIVLDRYGISHAEWSQILKEGIQKWW